MGRIAVTGSVAYDTIMVFQGRFADHILRERAHQLNVSFQVDRLERRRGGTAANISYTLALLGERPLLCGAVGAHDFADYAAALEEAGVDVSAALRCDDVPTGAAFITTDLDDNQITAFYAGAMARADQLDVGRLQNVSDVVVGANAAPAMARAVREAGSLGARLTFAPAQQIPSMSDVELRQGVAASWLLVGNDYEIEMIRQRTGFSLEDVGEHAMVAVTKGAAGSELHLGPDVLSIPAARAARMVDPTGAGDAYIAGILCALRCGSAPDVAARVGAAAASFVVEQPGPQGHGFTREQLAERYAASYDAVLPEDALPRVAAPA